MKHYLIILLVLLGSCIREVPFPKEATPPKLVMGCLFSTDSLFKVYISTSQGVFDTSQNYVSNAQVELWQNNQYAETLQHIEKGLYQSTLQAKTNIAYTLKVSAPGFTPIEASDIIPEKQTIQNAELAFDVGFDYTYLSNYNTTNFTFTNNPDKTLYYESLLVYKSWIDPIIIDSSQSWEDSILYYSIIPFIRSDNVFILAENYKFDAITPINSLVFSNELINTKNVNMLIRFDNGNSYIGSQIQFIIYLKSISKNYYLYKTSLRKHFENQEIIEPTSLEDYSELLFTGTPVDVYSNVKNGYGIFAAYSIDTLSFSISNPNLSHNNQ